MADWFAHPPRPMVALLAEEPFDAPNLIYEARWEGLRVLLGVRDGKVRLVDRDVRDVTSLFPEFRDAAAAVNAREALVDGVVVALLHGRPHVESLERRLSDQASAGDVRDHAAFVFVAFDLLTFNGAPLIDVKLRQRKDLLREVIRQSPTVVLGTWIERTGIAFLRQVEKVGIRGIVAKHLESIYEPGVRSPSWLRMQRIKEQDCVICGFTAGMGRREDLLGSLVLGVIRDGELVHAGQVGSGFDQTGLRQLHADLEPLVVDSPTLTGLPRIDRPITWTRPELTCEVQYQEWTRDRRLRSPRFVRLTGKSPGECEVEEVAVLANRRHLGPANGAPGHQQHAPVAEMVGAANGGTKERGARTPVGGI